MRRRAGFTLVELMVSMALIIIIMAILTEAFAGAQRAFTHLKAQGDMNARLRNVTTTIRQDLLADHFEAKRRLSDPSFSATPVREGFFRVYQGTPSIVAANDQEGNPAYTPATNQVMHFAAKRRGNRSQNFFSARIPDPTSPLFTQQTTFFNQPPEARYQELLPTPPPTPLPSSWVYRSQWGEIAYVLKRLPGNETTPGGTPRYALYRVQLSAVADNTALNWPPSPPPTGLPIPAANKPLYVEMSCKPDLTVPANLYFNNPSDLTDPTRRALDPITLVNPASPVPDGATLLLTDVLSFQVQVLLGGTGPGTGGTDFVDAPFDTMLVNNPATAASWVPIRALQVSIRVWDLKTGQTRQVTIMQDM